MALPVKRKRRAEVGDANGRAGEIGLIASEGASRRVAPNMGEVCLHSLVVTGGLVDRSPVLRVKSTTAVTTTWVDCAAAPDGISPGNGLVTRTEPERVQLSPADTPSGPAGTHRPFAMGSFAPAPGVTTGVEASSDAIGSIGGQLACTECDSPLTTTV